MLRNVLLGINKIEGGFGFQITWLPLCCWQINGEWYNSLECVYKYIYIYESILVNLGDKLLAGIHLIKSNMMFTWYSSLFRSLRRQFCGLWSTFISFKWFLITHTQNRLNSRFFEKLVSGRYITFGSITHLLDSVTWRELRHCVRRTKVCLLQPILLLVKTIRITQRRLENILGSKIGKSGWPLGLVSFNVRNFDATRLTYWPSLARPVSMHAFFREVFHYDHYREVNIRNIPNG